MGSQKTETLAQLEGEEILGANEGDQKKAEWLRLAGHVGVSGKAANLLSIRLVRQFLRRTEFRGSDVRLDLGLIWRLDAVARKTINPKQWVWQVAQA